MKVVTVIPNWNLKEDLGECIRSLEQSTWVDHEIVVVDNASTNGAAEYVRVNFPSVTLFALEENTGYAGALNAGIRYALERDAEFVFALNNDTVVPPEAISDLVAEMQRRPEIGVFTPKVLYFSRPDLLYSLGARSYPFLPLPVEFGHRWRDNESYSGVMEYDYVTGCAMLIRAAVFERVGLFEESYFMYYEDGDFCRRVREAGFRIACAGSVKILHKAALSSKILGTKMVYYRARNRVIFYRRFPHGPSPAFTALALWGMAVIYSIRNLAQGRPGWLKPYWSGFLLGWREPLVTRVSKSL